VPEKTSLIVSMTTLVLIALAPLCYISRLTLGLVLEKMLFIVSMTTLAAIALAPLCSILIALIVCRGKT